MTESAPEARLVAGSLLLGSLLVCALGLFVVPERHTVDLTSLVPLLFAVLGALLVALVVDPMLTPKQTPTADEVALFMSKSFLARLPFTELPVLAGLVTAVMHDSRTPLVLGAAGTVMLAAVWWPGEQFLSGMRRRLEPLSAGHLVDEVTAGSDGRMRLVKHAR